jgi:hypothetical protein
MSNNIILKQNRMIIASATECQSGYIIKKMDVITASKNYETV